MPSRARPATGQTEHECPAAFFTLFHADKIQGPLPHRTHSVDGLTVITKNMGNSSTYMVNEDSMRFSLTVKTKDATEMCVTHLRANPWQVAEDGLCVKVPSFHQPTYPAAQLRL